MSLKSRAEMRKVINEGGSVLFRGETFTEVATLPSEAEIALFWGNPVEVASAKTNLETEISTLKAQLDSLKAQEPKQEPKIKEDKVRKDGTEKVLEILNK